MNKPEWWPECPYPESVFPGDIRELALYIPGGAARTHMAGVLGRYFWKLAEDAIWQRMCEAADDLAYCPVCGTTL